MSGEFAKALFVVIKHREGDRSLSASEKDLSNFEISVAEIDKELLEVVFVPNSLPGEEIGLGGAKALGRSLDYGVRRKDFKIMYVRAFK